MHPLLALLVTRPHLLVDHAQAYVALVHEDATLAYASWRYQALLQVVALCCLGIAAMLAGVAVMLWAVTPAAQIHTPWVLLAMPVLPLCLAGVCMVMAHRQPRDKAFANLGRQISADIAMLRAVRTP